MNHNNDNKEKKKKKLKTLTKMPVNAPFTGDKNHIFAELRDLFILPPTFRMT